MIDRTAAVCAAACLIFMATSFALPQHAPRPGGLAVLTVDAANSNAPPVVEFDKKRVLVLRQEDEWIATIGIPLDQSIGAAEATVRAKGQQPRVIGFEVGPHAYREQRLNVSKSYVDLTEEQLNRVGRERKIIDNALSNWRDMDLTDLSLIAPVEGRRSSSFGLRRFFNDQPRSPHKGMDIAAELGTPIVSK